MAPSIDSPGVGKALKPEGRATVEIWGSLYDGEDDKHLGAHKSVDCPRVGETAVVGAMA
jgi:hypothetical protein